VENGSNSCKDRLEIEVLERLGVVWKALENVDCEMLAGGLDWTLGVIVQDPVVLLSISEITGM
jgi:hypothetical protein